MAQRPVLSFAWRGVPVVICVAIILIAGETAVSVGLAAAMGSGSLGDRVVWAVIAFGSAGGAVWFAFNRLRLFGIRRGWQAMPSPCPAPRVRLPSRDGGG